MAMLGTPLYSMKCSLTEALWTTYVLLSEEQKGRPDTTTKHQRLWGVLSKTPRQYAEFSKILVHVSKNLTKHESREWLPQLANLHVPKMATNF